MQTNHVLEYSTLTLSYFFALINMQVNSNESNSWRGREI